MGWLSAPRNSPRPSRGQIVLSAEARPALRSEEQSRREFSTAALAIAAACTLTLTSTSAAQAYVRGNTPPEDWGKLKKYLSGGSGCISEVECEKVGAKIEAEKYGPNQNYKYEKTASGVRYKDLEPGNKDAGVAKSGDTLRLRYRVMRSGKRSADGLSGEASTIFSLGYGEDDGPKDAVLTAPLGQGKFVKALEEGLVGLAVGGRRRVQVRPEYGLGWKKSGKCAGEIGVGAVAGLPGAGVENEGDCLDESKLPKPVDFAAQRRFARRFDESLIVEVDLVGLGEA